MTDSFIEQYTNELTEEEKKKSEKIYQDFLHGDGDYKGYGAMSDEKIIENLFHGDTSKIQQRIKEVEDIHVKPVPGGKFKVSRYSEERQLAEKDDISELKKQNSELKKEFDELKKLIIEKMG